MRALALAALAATLAGSPAAAQIAGGVVIGSGPVRGAVVFGAPVRVVRPYYPPAPYYAAPNVVLVEDWYGPRGYGYGWYRNHGYAPRWMWWDGYRFYNRNYGGFRRVQVYERGGRFYRDPDGYWGGGREWDRDDYRDRDDRRWRDEGRFDDRRWNGRGYGRGDRD